MRIYYYVDATVVDGHRFEEKEFNFSYDDLPVIWGRDENDQIWEHIQSQLPTPMKLCGIQVRRVEEEYSRMLPDSEGFERTLHKRRETDFFVNLKMMEEKKVA